MWQVIRKQKEQCFLSISKPSLKLNADFFNIKQIPDASIFRCPVYARPTVNLH